MALQIAKNAVSQSVLVALKSTSTGLALTSIAYNTAGLTAYYCIPGQAPVQITLASLAAANSAYSSGGWFELDAAHMPGLYRLDLPNACFSSGGSAVVVELQGATGLAPCAKEIEITAYDPTNGVNLGLTAIPNVAQGTRGQLLADSTVIETAGNITVQQALSTFLAVLAGQTINSGGTFKTPDGSAARVAATTDASNQRTAITLTPSA